MWRACLTTYDRLKRIIHFSQLGLRQSFQSWACDNFSTLRQATTWQCDNIIRLLWHAKRQNMIAPQSQNRGWTQYLAVMCQTTIFWPKTCPALILKNIFFPFVCRSYGGPLSLYSTVQGEHRLTRVRLTKEGRIYFIRNYLQMWGVRWRTPPFPKYLCADAGQPASLYGWNIHFRCE